MRTVGGDAVSGGEFVGSCYPYTSLQIGFNFFCLFIYSLITEPSCFVIFLLWFMLIIQLF